MVCANVVLSDDCLAAIFLKLTDPRDYLACSAVCKRWLSIESHLSREFQLFLNNESGISDFLRPAGKPKVSRCGEPQGNFRRGEIHETIQSLVLRLSYKSGTLVRASNPTARNEFVSSMQSRTAELLRQKMKHPIRPYFCREKFDRTLFGPKSNNISLQLVAVSCFAYLQNLILSHCSEVTSDGLTAIGTKCPNLVNFKLNSCPNICDIGMKAIAKGCPKLQILAIQNCTGISEDSIIALSKSCRDLRVIEFNRSCEIGDKSLQSVGNYCSSLTSLTVIDCPISSRGIAEIAWGCPSLEKVELAKLSLLTDDGMAALAGACKKLMSLEISECENITDDTLSAMASNAGSLRNLALKSLVSVSKYGLSCIQFIHTLKTLSLGPSEEAEDKVLMSVAASCSNLSFFSIDGWPLLTENGLKAIVSNCRNLKTLRVTNCDSVSGFGLTKNSVVSKLEQVEISNCKSLADTGVSLLLSSCPDLRILKITHCPQLSDSCWELEESAVEAIKLKRATLQTCLERLDISHSSSLTDRSLLLLCECFGASLKSLWMSKCPQITDVGLFHIAQNCPLLEELNMGYCVRITDSGLSEIAVSCPNLVTLSVSGCREISQSGMAAVGSNLKSLSALFLSSCPRAAKSSLLALSSCGNLKHLALRQTNLSPENVAGFIMKNVDVKL